MYAKSIECSGSHASQAAFALESARLYKELVEQHRQSARTEEQLRTALADLARVKGDRIQLQQVAINLLLNGAESMMALETDRRLWLACAVEEFVIRVTVEDLGSGIAPEIADRLVEPLFTTKENGMGMGLSICKSIVDAHNGTLELSARPEGGTRATVVLPRLCN